jgi:hypothetical protein
MISVGGVLGKLNPLQILVMCVIESAMFVLSCFVGYEILGVVDVGKYTAVYFLKVLVQLKITYY